MMKTRWFTRSQREQPSTATVAGTTSPAITTSERSAASSILTNSERSRNESIDIDIDFSVTESGRTVAHLVNNNNNNTGMEKDDDGLDFSITSSGRTIEHIMQDHMSAANNQQQKNNDEEGNNNIPMGVPAVRATISNPLTIPPSPARAIPHPNHDALLLLHNNNNNPSHPGSQDSSGSAFLNGILNPSATATSTAQQLSHTPPSAFGTSYETTHFGKRQRSGSVSGRLRSASDLEEKGLIDRQQKGILKDLIICGDEDLQRALDKYEEGNPTDLQNMIRSGALQNKAVPDLDLLGDLDLDLDFLTVTDGDTVHVNDLGGGQEGPGMYTLTQQQAQHAQQQHQQHHLGAPHQATTAQRSTMIMMKPPPPRQAGGDNMAQQHPRTASNASSGIGTHEYDDGIGELEFTGDFGDNAEGYYGGGGTTANDHSHIQFMNQPHPGAGKQHRPGSPPIGAGDDMRLRSNSLFSALINEPKPVETHDLQYGGWMDRVPAAGAALANLKNSQFNDMVGNSSSAAPANAAASQPIPIQKADKFAALIDTCNNNMQVEEETTKPQPTRKKPGRRKSDSSAMEDRKEKARLKQELAEQKRREKQEKREKKEREKQEKKEARLLAKAEKKKHKEQKKDTGATAMSVDEEEKPVHVPGSGRPRSMSDPNLRATRDEFGHVEIERPDGWIGAYSPESRKKRIDKFLAKRHQRVWTKTVKYDVRKNFADSRLRVKGRFVKKEDEMLMRDLMSMT